MIILNDIFAIKHVSTDIYYIFTQTKADVNQNIKMFIVFVN